MSETKIVSGDWTHQSLRTRLLVSHSGLIETSLCLLCLYMCENNYLYTSLYIRNIFIDRLRVAYLKLLLILHLLLLCHFKILLDLHKNIATVRISKQLKVVFILNTKTYIYIYFQLRLVLRFLLLRSF